MDQLAKIHRHRWKERLKISTVAKFESDRMKTNKDVAPCFHETAFKGWFPLFRKFYVRTGVNLTGLKCVIKIRDDV